MTIPRRVAAGFPAVEAATPFEHTLRPPKLRFHSRVALNDVSFRIKCDDGSQGVQYIGRQAAGSLECPADRDAVRISRGAAISAPPYIANATKSVAAVDCGMSSASNLTAPAASVG